MADDAPSLSDEHSTGIPATNAAATGRLLVLIAAIAWSTSGLFAALLPFEGLVLAFWRALFAGLALLPTVRRPMFSVRLLPMMLAFVAMNYTFLTALVQHDATCTIWLQHTAPAWVVVLGLVFLRHRPSQADWVMLPWAMLGVGIILAFELRGESPISVVYGLLSGITYAIVVLSIRQLRDVDPQWLISLNLLFTALALGPFVWRAGGDSASPTPWQFVGLALFGIIQMGTPYVLFAKGLQRITSLQASSIVLVEPILVPVWVYFLRGDIPRWWTVVGASLILLGLAMQIRHRKAAARPTMPPA